jgi:hypothetical protein
MARPSPGKPDRYGPESQYLWLIRSTSVQLAHAAKLSVRDTRALQRAINLDDWDIILGEESRQVSRFALPDASVLNSRQISVGLIKTLRAIILWAL